MLILFALSFIVGALAARWSNGSADRADKYSLSVIAASLAAMVLLLVALLNHSTVLGTVGIALTLYGSARIFRR